MRTIAITLLTLTIAVLAVPGQVPTPIFREVPYAMESGFHTNSADSTLPVWTGTITIPGAEGLRIAFEEVQLERDDDTIVIYNPRDGETQVMNRAALKMWSRHSACFNGSHLIVSLHLAPGSSGSVSMLHVLESIPLPDAICGADDRVPSADSRAFRIVGGGVCSGFLINDRSVFATAGHCNTATSGTPPVAQFNVPPSSAAGILNAPPVADQFPVDQSSVIESHGWNGLDWAVGRLHPNANGETASARNGWFTIASSHPAVGATVRVTGYGGDNTPAPSWNHIQQTDTGAFVFVNTFHFMGHLADMTPGNSGCPIIVEASDEAIGINTHDGCSSATTGSNKGTSLLKPEFQTAFQSVAGCGSVYLQDGVPQSLPCDDVLFDVNPVASRWNAVGVSSTGDWDISIESSYANSFGGVCDFLIADGRAGNLPPIGGRMYHYSGSTAATGEFQSALPFNIGAQAFSSMPAGQILQVYEFEVTTATLYDIYVAGDPSLTWRLYAPGSDSSWNADEGSTFQFGAAAGTTWGAAALSPGWHCLVVSRDGGPALTSTPLTIHVCVTSSLVSVPHATPVAVTSPCAPIYVAGISQGNWNVVAVSSPSDWDILLGSGQSQSGGATCDFVVANGKLGNIGSSNGVVTRYSGPDPAVVEHQVGGPMSIGTSLTGTIATGHILAAAQFYVTLGGNYSVGVNGPTPMSWSVFDPGTDARWRPRSESIASGVVGGIPTSGVYLNPGWHLLVVAHAGGPLTGLESGAITLNVCASNSPLALTQGNVQSVINSCEPISITPDAGHFNAIGVSSSDPWSIAMGPAFATRPVPKVAFVLADGSQGSPHPTTGILGQVSGSSGCEVQHAARTMLTPGTPHTRWWPDDVLHLYEIDVITPGSYDITVSGPSVLGWTLYEPLNHAAWITSSQGSLYGSAGSGATRTLAAGKHGIVVTRDLFAVVTGNVTVSVVPSPQPVPVLTSISPATILVGSGSMTLTAHGTSFQSGSVVYFESHPLPTTFVSPTQLQASVGASHLSSPGTPAITVVTPPPGGGISAPVTLTIANPAPIVTSLTPTTVTAGGPAFSVTVNGSGFNPYSAVQWNGTPLGTSYVSSTQLEGWVLAPFITASGTALVTVRNPPPGGGLSSSLPVEIINPAPITTSVTPPSAPVGSGQTNIAVTGTGFVAASTVRADGLSLTTTFVSSTDLQAILPASSLLATGQVLIDVLNPAPGGGASGTVAFDVLPPVIVSLSPSLIPVSPSGGPPLALTITGQSFLPGSQVFADGIALPTTHGPGALSASLQPALVLSATQPGGIAINVQNTVDGVSNTVALVVGGGNNAGTQRLQPLAPAPGGLFTFLMEGNAGGAVFSLFADFPSPVPLPGWPDPIADFVIGVGPPTGSTGPFLPLLDGLGMFGPPQGFAFNPSGEFAAPVLMMANPPAGQTWALQAVYLDSTSPTGWRLNWTRSVDL